jgi:selenium-binding protein 1
VLYTVALYVGTGVEQPDYLATVDVHPESPTYSRVVERTTMPNVGDELHHFGWNACSSCHDDEGKSRRFLVVPGQRSSRIHIIDTAEERSPKLHKVIEPEEIVEKTNLTAPHTVHCLPDRIMISMVGDGEGNGPGGFLLLDEDFNVAGRWDRGTDGMNFNYDFWYQPRHNVMVSSEWAAPNTYNAGFDPKDVAEGKYGRQLHFWDWEKHEISQSVDLGEDGWIPLEVRFHHNPESAHGFVGAALSSNMYHWHKENGHWEVEKVIDVPSEDVEGWPMPIPSLITDLLLSMDDRFLYLSILLHCVLRKFDVSVPSIPSLTGQVWFGCLLVKSL